MLAKGAGGHGSAGELIASQGVAPTEWSWPSSASRVHRVLYRSSERARGSLRVFAHGMEEKDCGCVCSEGGGRVAHGLSGGEVLDLCAWTTDNLLCPVPICMTSFRKSR